jgi:hypothetical protein
MVPFLATVCAVHLGLNSALFPGQWRYAGLVWYFLVEYLFLFLVLGWCFGRVLESCSNSLFEKVRFGALALYVVALVPILLWRPSLPSEQELKYIGARWMNQNLPSDAVVAASNAGVTGYFSTMPVINLDGLVNDVDFFEHYLKRKRVRDYLLDNKVTHLADHDCPKDEGGWFWDWVRVPDEGEIRFCREGNEKGLDFCVIEITALKRTR